MRKAGPAVLKPNAACPWPDTTTDGIQYQRAEEAVAAESKMVPDSTTVGVPEPTGTLSSYQRAASRSRLGDATPVESTAMLCAVHNLPLRMWAANNRSSSASSCPLVPLALTLIGSAVAFTVIAIFAEMAGVPPGLLMRRMTNRPKVESLGPMMYPSVAAGS
ncbi:MAG: hypothetical protein DME73_06210 [Verrucomicrobia bacterium]|nr:MAG: hypothetical protein DME73_06210 [Verrucomicrobiota bacterium]